MNGSIKTADFQSQHPKDVLSPICGLECNVEVAKTSITGVMARYRMKVSKVDIFKITLVIATLSSINIKYGNYQMVNTEID